MESQTENLCIEICTKNLRRVILYQINLEKQNSSKKNLKRKHLPKNHWREINTKIFPKQISTQKSTKRHSLPTDWKEESLQKTMKNIFAEISANSLPKTPWREIYTKQIPTETSTKKVLAKTSSTTNPLKRNLHKAILKRNPAKKHIWWKNLPKKSSTNKYVNIKFDPNMSEDKFARKKDSRNFGGKSSPIYPWRIVFGELFFGGNNSPK